MSTLITSQQKLFGLLELDQSGTVIYARLESHNKLDDELPNVSGHNFFSEVVPFQNVTEFHQRLEAFKCSSEQANSFVFDCNYDDGTVPVRVLLARIRERNNSELTKSLLVHIKKAY